ncbi:hypothetical protein ACIQBJ_08885 [Kitasatospora sp. NPDC088391]|uniref:hypothetical protein n=1 Tax=Kitasatospora sp. NPDC088391 TaxID=3364074 RepID=UPI00382177BE
MAGENDCSTELTVRVGAQVAERQDFAVQLRALFERLGTSYREYGKSRFVSPSTLSRYLSGERLPSRAFVEELLDDLRTAGHSVSPADRDAVLDSRELALRNGNRVQQLHAQLESAQSELSDAKARGESLARDLVERERDLNGLELQLRRLNEEQEIERRSKATALADVLLEYRRLEEERDRLRAEVDELRREVLSERMRALRAEEQCSMLAWDLAEVGEKLADGSFGFLFQDLERAPVPDLVALVAGADAEYSGIATEVVRSAGQLRPVDDVVALFVALQDAGRQQHAELALPAAVVARSADDVSALVEGFHREGLDSYTSIVVRTVVEVSPPTDLVHLITRLHSRGFHGPAEVLTAAVAVARPTDEVVPILAAVDRQGLGALVVAALRVAADERPVADLAELIGALDRAGQHDLCRVLLIAARGARNPADMAGILTRLLAPGRERLAEEALTDLAKAGPPPTVVAAITALHGAGAHEWATDARQQAVLHRPVPDVAELISGFLTEGVLSHAAEAMAEFLLDREIGSRADLFRRPDGLAEQVSAEVLSHAAVTLSRNRVSSMIAAFAQGCLEDRAVFLLTAAVAGRPPGDVVEILVAPRHGAFDSKAIQVALREAARLLNVPNLAALIVTLDETNLVAFGKMLWRSAVDGSNLRPWLQEALQEELSRRPGSARPSNWLREVLPPPEDLPRSAPPGGSPSGPLGRFWRRLTERVDRPGRRELLDRIDLLRRSQGRMEVENARLRAQLDAERIRREAAETRAAEARMGIPR